MLALTPFRRYAPYDPFKELERLEQRFFGDRSPSGFPFDLYEEEDRYIVEADLPGFMKNEIEIEIEAPYLTIRASRESSGAEQRRYIHSERFFGRFERTFDVSGVDTDAILAGYENGVLKLTMPKKKADSPKKKSLEIE